MLTDAFCKTVAENDVIHYNTRLGNVVIDSLEAAEVDGKLLPLHEDGFQSLMKLAKMPRTFGNTVATLLGEETHIKLVNALRGAIAERKGLEVTVTLDPSGTILGVTQKASKITSQGFLQLVEQIFDRYDLKIATTLSSMGNVLVATTIPDVSYRIGDLEDEIFQTGLGLSLRLGEVQIQSYTIREICTNGMLGSHTDIVDGLKDLEPRKMVEFYERLDKLANRKFLPPDFDSNANRAMKTRASIREVQDVRSAMNRYATGDRTDDFLEWFLPIRDIYAAYRAEGIDPSHMSAKQRSNAMTNLTVWDAVNALTDFASHDQESRGFTVPQDAVIGLQRRAGDLLNRKAFDTENLIKMPKSLN